MRFVAPGCFILPRHASLENADGIYPTFEATERHVVETRHLTVHQEFGTDAEVDDQVSLKAIH